MSGSENRYTREWVADRQSTNSRRSTARNRHSAPANEQSDQPSGSSNHARSSRNEHSSDSDWDELPRRYRRMSQAAERPPSAVSSASSYGSADSGLSHPPGSSTKKKKRIVRQDGMTSVVRRHGRPESAVNRPPQEGTFGSPDDKTPRPQTNVHVVSSTSRDPAPRGQSRRATNRDRIPAKASVRRARRSTSPDDRTPRPFAAPALPLRSRNEEYRPQSGLTNTGRSDRRHHIAEDTSEGIKRRAASPSDDTPRAPVAIPNYAEITRNREDREDTWSLPDRSRPSAARQRSTARRHDDPRSMQAPQAPRRPSPARSRIPVPHRTVIKPPRRNEKPDRFPKGGGPESDP